MEDIVFRGAKVSTRLTLFVVEKLFESSVDPNSLAMIVNCTDFDET